jgi:prepilin-type N-terminal cleavage/methylation domain-containing protein
VRAGFTLVEVIAAAAIITIVILGTIEASLKSLKIFNQATAREGLEAVASEDIGWLRAYSKSWHCEVGPYEGCKVKSQGLASAVNYLPEIYSEDINSDYDRFKHLCLNRFVAGSASTPAHQMLSDAAATDADGNYDPPNPVASEELTLDLSEAPQPSQSYKLYRTITVDPTGNSVEVSYYTKSNDSPTMKFRKIEKLFIEATAWCP